MPLSECIRDKLDIAPATTLLLYYEYYYYYYTCDTCTCQDTCNILHLEHYSVEP
jgi:hypothetical protein